jgi:hypothetical protein
MPLQSSIISVNTQIDGRRQVEELHTDTATGLTYPWFWQADQDDDLDANMALHAAQVAAQIAGSNG